MGDPYGLACEIIPNYTTNHSNYNNWLVVSKKKYVHPYLGKIPNLTNIFQMG